MRDEKLSDLEESHGLAVTESRFKIAMPDISNLVPVDVRALRSGRVCRPGQDSLGGALIATFPSMAILAQAYAVVLAIGCNHCG